MWGALQVFGHRGQISGLAFAPDGRLLASSGEDGRIRLLDVANGRLVQHIAPVAQRISACLPIYSLAWGPSWMLGRARLVAFAMGHVKRLGQRSLIRELDGDLLRIILHSAHKM